MADTKISALTAATTPLAGTEVLPIVQSGVTVKVAVSNLTAGRDIAATSLTTAVVQAASSAGGTLKNNSGTAQMQWGSGGGSNLSLEVATNINPANAAVSISPTGTGTVAISPAGALTINPTTASTINNTSIGATTASTGRFTSVTATTGNVIIGTSGQGIDFSATPGTGTSELLDDYEEGTWTPVVVGTTTSGTGTYTTQLGTYTKIGRVVTLQCTLAWSAHTGTGNIAISGIPFTNGGITAVGSVFASNMDFGTLATQLTAFVLNSDTNIVFRGMINNASRADVPLDSSVDNLAVTLSYEQSAV
jgi:hypothetical protein